MVGPSPGFGLIANRCSAADEYVGGYGTAATTRLGLSWAKFCEERAGIGRGYANRLIDHLEEFGTNYFRLSG